MCGVSCQSSSLVRCAHARACATQGTRPTVANFSSVDLTGRDFSGLNLRGIKMDRALLSGADFTGAHLQSANLIGASAERAYFDRADLSRARLSGANLVSASLEDSCLAKAEMEFALMANVTLRGACLREADMRVDTPHLHSRSSRSVEGCGCRCIKFGSISPTLWTAPNIVT